MASVRRTLLGLGVLGRVAGEEEAFVQSGGGGSDFSSTSISQSRFSNVGAPAHGGRRMGQNRSAALPWGRSESGMRAKPNCSEARQ